jgi:Bacterial SCP ortholog
MKQDLEVKNRVREILKIVQQVAPGNSVELRIPPYAAIQCIPGSVHRRGTPPNVVEMSGQTLIELVGNPNYWDEFCHKGRISASGTNANLKNLFNKVSKLDSGTR